MPKILSIETGTDICSVGLSLNGELISLRESNQGRDHAKNIAVFVDEIFKQTSVTASEIDAVAVGIGPGSYTGLRIGISIAKGFCYANNIPLIAVSSLYSLCRCAVEDRSSGIVDFELTRDALLVPMIDARRMEVYMQCFDSELKDVTQVEARIIDATSFEHYVDRDVVMFGNGAAKCFDMLSNSRKSLVDVAPSARGLVAMAHEKFEKSDFVDLAYFEPLYLKNFIGTKSQKNYLL